MYVYCGKETFEGDNGQNKSVVREWIGGIRALRNEKRERERKRRKWAATEGREGRVEMGI